MKKFFANLVYRFTSRKFLLTVSTALVLIANKEWSTLTALIGGYIGIEGFADVAQRYGETKVTASKTDLESTKLQVLGADALPETGVDKNAFVPGMPAGQ